MEKSPRDRADSQLPLHHHSTTPSSSSSSNHNPSHALNNNSSSTSDGVVTFLNSTPKSQPPIARSDSNNPYPTTFVQADTSSFKQVVQMLTGSSQTAKLASQSQSQTPRSPHSSAADPNLHHYHNTKNPIPPTRPVSKPKPSRLYERRNSFTNALRGINPLIPIHANFSSSSPRKLPEAALSPSLLDFPGLVLSPVTPLIHDPFNGSPSSIWVQQPQQNHAAVEKLAEEKAIAEKGFYLHRSPNTTPRDSSGEPPRLLPLFPVSSPKVTGSDELKLNSN